MMSFVTKYRPQQEFSTQERCSINELLNQAVHSECSIARASVAPGVTTQLHSIKNTIERYVILEGKGQVFVGGSKPQSVEYLDVVTIPAGVPQKIHNSGECELIFLCICTPRFEQKNYQQLGQ